jgi:hypothetical protein
VGIAKATPRLPDHAPRSGRDRPDSKRAGLVWPGSLFVSRRLGGLLEEAASVDGPATGDVVVAGDRVDGQTGREVE